MEAVLNKPVLRRLRVVLSFVVLATLLVGAESALANAPKVHGIELISWSKKIDEDRYQSPRNWDKTVDYFQKYFRGWRGVRWHREVNLPTIKYIHIENTHHKGEWAGINIYELPGGKVRVYVLKREPKVEPAGDAAKADKAEKTKTDKSR